jgi:hypothetical protein
MSDGFLNDLGLDTVEADPNHIANGKYPAFVYNSEVRTKKDGTKSWVITYKIAPDSPRHAGQQQQEWFDLEPKGENADLKKSFLKRRVLSLGVPETRINSVNPGDLIGIKVSLEIVHRGQYQNVGTVEVLDDSGSVAAPVASAASSTLL